MHTWKEAEGNEIVEQIVSSGIDLRLDFQEMR
jgi:hypothetical protein